MSLARLACLRILEIACRASGKLGGVYIQPVQGSAGIHRDGCKWLIDFMRDGSRQLASRRESIQMSKFHPGLGKTQLIFLHIQLPIHRTGEHGDSEN
jgi:hypothetical protein